MNKDNGTNDKNEDSEFTTPRCHDTPITHERRGAHGGGRDDEEQPSFGDITMMISEQQQHNINVRV